MIADAMSVNGSKILLALVAVFSTTLLCLAIPVGVHLAHDAASRAHNEIRRMNGKVKIHAFQMKVTRSADGSLHESLSLSFEQKSSGENTCTLNVGGSSLSGAGLLTRALDCPNTPDHRVRLMQTYRDEIVTEDEKIFDELIITIGGPDDEGEGHRLETSIFDDERMDCGGKEAAEPPFTCNLLREHAPIEL